MCFTDFQEKYFFMFSRETKGHDFLYLDDEITKQEEAYSALSEEEKEQVLWAMKMKMIMQDQDQVSINNEIMYHFYVSRLPITT